MRVLHIDTGREMRGGQWQALYLIEGLLQEGHECVLLARGGSPLLEAASSRGIEARPLGLAGLLRQSRLCDIVHAHDARGHTLAAAARARPLVVSRRVAFPIPDNVASRIKYSRAEHFLAVSRHVRDGLIAARVPEGKISVVYDGVPLARPTEGGRTILAPASEDPAKGSALVREAARLASLDVRFSNCLQEDLPSAAFLVYITHQEGLGSGALLAMAAGVPVIASRVGGLPEAVLDGGTGLLTGNTPSEIAEAMRKLAGGGELCRGLGARAREHVRDRFSVAAMVRATLDVYHRVLSC